MHFLTLDQVWPSFIFCSLLLPVLSFLSPSSSLSPRSLFAHSLDSQRARYQAPQKQDFQRHGLDRQADSFFFRKSSVCFILPFCRRRYAVRRIYRATRLRWVFSANWEEGHSKETSFSRGSLKRTSQTYIVCKPCTCTVHFFSIVRTYNRIYTYLNRKTKQAILNQGRLHSFFVSRFPKGGEEQGVRKWCKMCAECK